MPPNDFLTEAEARGFGGDLVGEVGAQGGTVAAFLAFGAQADAAAQGREERTGFELVQRVLDGGGTAQVVSPLTASPHAPDRAGSVKCDRF